MFRQQDTLDMHVYSKNISQKYTYVQVAKYLMKKKESKESEQEKNKKEEKNKKNNNK